MKDYSKLTDEQLRIAVAETLGGYSNARCPCGCGCRVLLKNSDRSVAPKWPRDLNACHEFEEALGDGQKADYGRALFDILGLVERMNAWGWFDLAHATARQRCIALLAVLKPE